MAGEAKLVKLSLGTYVGLRKVLGRIQATCDERITMDKAVARLIKDWKGGKK